MRATLDAIARSGGRYRGTAIIDESYTEKDFERMHDPQVQAAYRQYAAQSGGRPAMDFPTFTYNYVYTRGFSRDGSPAREAARTTP